MEAFIFALIIIVIVGSLINGAVKTFRRNIPAALLMMFLLFPLWVCWAIIEMWTPDLDD